MFTPTSHSKRIARRRGLVFRYSYMARLSFFLIGYGWMLLIPTDVLSRPTWIDENALQPNSVATHWDWDDVRHADRYLENMESMRDRNASKLEFTDYILHEFQALGLLSSTQAYSFNTTSMPQTGVNVYASLPAPHASGSEAIVISAAWRSLSFVEGSRTERNLNLRGIAILLSLAGHLRKLSLWAKDIIFIVSDGHLDGMHAFLTKYHGSLSWNLHAESLLHLTGGVIWTAFSIDYPGHSFSDIGLYYEGMNAHLPNQDLLNSVHIISRWTGQAPVLLYDHLTPHHHASKLQKYESKVINVLKHVGYQTFGRPSGVHGLFHQYRIDAITLYAVPAVGPHGFYTLGKIMESSLRTANNLLERLHASFFFYLLTGPATFVAIGKYLPSAVLVGIGMELNGLQAWVASGWVSMRCGSATSWHRRRRPVFSVLGLMFATHAFGYASLLFTTSRVVVNALEAQSYYTLLMLALILASPPLLVCFFGPELASRPGHASASSVLWALLLCISGTTICVTSVLNFSLAASLAILLGVPLSLVGSTRIPTLIGARAKYGWFLMLTPGGLGILASFWLGREEVTRIVVRTVWEWEVLGVWFLPFVCCVYYPFVLQACFVALLPP